MKNLIDIRRCLIEIVGIKNYTDQETDLINYASSANGKVIRPIGIVYPKNTTEIVAIVKLANLWEMELYPISRGKNWGYGSAQGTRKNQLIVDLRNMDSILEVNAELCYIRLQPGVSQQQAYKYLESLPNTSLQMDMTGAGTGASVIGNILERGFGHSEYGDRFQRIINMTVVLPDGAVIQTGFGAFKNADALHTYRYGVGPCIDGLFTQSNLGIVTEMTLELMPKPEMFCAVIGTVKRDDDIVKLLLSLKELSLSGVIQSKVHIANKARVVGAKKSKIGAWTFSASISGPKRMVAAKKKVLTKELKRNVRKIRLWFVRDFTLSLIGFINRHIRTIPDYENITLLCNLLKGIPSDVPLQTLLNDEDIKPAEMLTCDFPLYFRWISAVCKAEQKSVNKLLQLLSPLFKQYDYELRITFTLLNPRSLLAIVNISYTKYKPSVEKAERFYRLCTEKLIKNGYYPYRSGAGMYPILKDFQSNSQVFFQKLKNTLDPNDIMAPNKYNL